MRMSPPLVVSRRPRPQPRSGSSARPWTTSRRMAVEARHAVDAARQAGLITEGFGASG